MIKNKVQDIERGQICVDEQTFVLQNIKNQITVLKNCSKRLFFLIISKKLTQ